MSLRTCLTTAPEIIARVVAHRGAIRRGLCRWRSPWGPTVWQIGVPLDQLHLQGLFQHMHQSGARVPSDLGVLQDALERLVVVLVPKEPGFRQIGLWRGRGAAAVGLLVMEQPQTTEDRADLARAIAAMVSRRAPAMSPAALLAGWLQ